MSNYKLNKAIPSVFVGKDLITRIENYLTERLPATLKANTDASEKKIEYKYTLTISDKYGDEEFATINDYHRDKINNDTKRIDISLDTSYRLVDFHLSFSTGQMFSYLQISAYTDGSKELANAIMNEIEGLLEENKTINYIFYAPTSWIIYTIFTVSIAVNYFGDIKRYSVLDNTIMGIIISGLLYIVFKEISPYSTFDTKREEKKRGIVNWFLKGFAGLLIFGVGAIYLKKCLA